MSHSCSTHCENASPIQVLKDEHRVIETVLDAMERALSSDTVDRDFFEKALDFIRNFADGCHHAKEEGELFPVLERLGIPREGGPIGCMLSEHEEGRALVRSMSDNLTAASGGDLSAVIAVRQAAQNYVDLLRQHIQKEDNVLFVMADDTLGSDEQKLMLEAFERAEESSGDSGKHERYIALAKKLSQWEFATV